MASAALTTLQAAHWTHQQPQELQAWGTGTLALLQGCQLCKTWGCLAQLQCSTSQQQRCRLTWPDLRVQMLFGMAGGAVGRPAAVAARCQRRRLQQLGRQVRPGYPMLCRAAVCAANGQTPTQWRQQQQPGRRQEGWMVLLARRLAAVLRRRGLIP